VANFVVYDDVGAVGAAKFGPFFVATLTGSALGNVARNCRKKRSKADGRCPANK